MRTNGFVMNTITPETDRSSHYFWAFMRNYCLDSQLITTQLYFPGDPHNEDDIASAVKPELMLDIQPAESGEGNQTTYNFELDPA